MEQTVYKFIIEHINNDGRFTEDGLCDEAEKKNSLPLGAWDANFYNYGKDTNHSLARKIVKALRIYILEPEQVNYLRLTEVIKGHALSEYCNAFFHLIDRAEMNITLFNLAKKLFYEGEHREQVKLAYMLFSLKGMEYIKLCYVKLWRDLVQVAHCEEFTFPFLFACHESNYFPQREVWELLGCTDAWGKIFCLMDCRCDSDAERRWLLRHGPELKVDYPPISLRLIEETRLEEFLKQELDYDSYKGAATIMADYLAALPRFASAEMAEHFNIASVNLYPMLKELLAHAKRLVTKAEDLLDIVHIVDALQYMQETNKPFQLSQNQCQALIAACDELLYDAKWREDLKPRLFAGGKVNYGLCDYAFNTGLDIWQEIFAYWEEHVMETDLLPYLLASTKERADLVLKRVTAHLKQYIGDELALLVPLRYLSDHPGEGIPIICAALKSMYDLPRGLACNALTTWGQSYITPLLRNALLTARRLSTDKMLTAHIDVLLHLEGRRRPQQNVDRNLLN